MEGANMEMLYCPGCACHLCDSKAACPVCGAPRTGRGIAISLRNPFKLIALCVFYAVAIWFASMFLIGFVAGEPGQTLSGPLLLASIGLSIAFTVRGKLPGTAPAGPPSP
jgi:hypothetical protein